MTPEWTLRRRITALFLIVGTVLTFLATGATITAAANRGQLDRLLDSVEPARSAASNLLATLVNQETSVRGFVLDRQAEELGLYQLAVTAEDRYASAITSSSVATKEISDNVSRARELAARWRDTVANPAIAATQADDRASAQRILSESGDVQFDEIRGVMFEIERALQEIHDNGVESIKGTSSTLLFVLIAAVVLVITGGIGILIVLQQAVINPVTYLAAQVRAVAEGDYARAISTEGPPELTRLAHDVDSMRQRIASDLAGVEAARRELEHAHRLLEQQAAELTRSNRDLEQFAYVASHDLSEPLRKVSSFCQLLQRRYAGQLDEKADQYLGFAVNGAQRMQRLINDLLAFSRIGRTTSGFIDVDLERVVAEAAAHHDIDDAGNAEITWSELPVVRGEEQLLGTLFANLIGNSLKFRRPGEPARVQISARRVGDQWEVACVDNGIGIEREFTDKVFVIFQRLHPRDAYPGTGIGLAVAKKIVEYHGGDIWVDTSHRDGAAIRFTLPVTAAVAGAHDTPPRDDRPAGDQPPPGVRSSGDKPPGANPVRPRESVP